MSAAVRRAALAVMVAITCAPGLAAADVDPGPDPLPPPAEPHNPAGDLGTRTPTDASGNAQADGPPVYFRPPVGKDIIIKSTPDRPAKTIAILAGVAGAGLLIGGVGVYYNLDARTAADNVSAQVFTNTTWTAARQADYDRANRSSTRAEIAYGVGGSLLVAAAIALIVTAPAEETTVIHPHLGAAPTRGGASLSADWSF